MPAPEKNKFYAARKPKGTDWSDAQIKTLKKLYPTTDNAVVATSVEKSEKAVRSKAQALKLKKSERYWDKPQEDFVLKNYAVMSAKEIGVKLKKTKWAVINKFRELTGKRGEKK